MKNLLFLTIATMLIWGACKRDNSISNLPDVYHYLTLSQIQKTPYFINPDFDTLTFVSNKNDTLIFAKIKTDTSYYKTYERWCFDCRTQTNYHQTLRNTYQTLKGNGKFEVRHVTKGYLSFVFEFLPLQNNFIEIKFINDYYVIFEDIISDKRYRNYLGNIIDNNIDLKDCHFEFKNLNNTSKNIGIISSKYGLFQIIDSLTNVNYKLILK